MKKLFLLAFLRNIQIYAEHSMEEVKSQFAQKHYTLRDFKGYSSNSCDNIWQMVLLCYQAPLMHKLLFLAKRVCVVLIKNYT